MLPEDADVERGCALRSVRHDCGEHREETEEMDTTVNIAIVFCCGWDGDGRSELADLINEMRVVNLLREEAGRREGTHAVLDGAILNLVA